MLSDSNMMTERNQNRLIRENPVDEIVEGFV